MCIKSFVSAVITAAVLFFTVPTQPLFGQDSCESVVGNIVLNCGFESSSVFWTYTSLGASRDPLPPSAYVFSGSRAILFTAIPQPVHSFTLFQSLNTVVGATYQLSFWYRNSSASSSNLIASFGSQNTSISVTSVLNSYRNEVVNSLTAISPSTLLQFQVPGMSSSQNFALDTISVVCTANCVVPIPEPATWLMMSSIVGMSMFVGILRKRSAVKTE